MTRKTKGKITGLFLLLALGFSFGVYAAQKEQNSAIPNTKPPVIPKTQDDTIQKIQGQINEIIRMNENIKARQQGDMQEIQRIMDQSRIHQRLLEELKAAQENKREIKPSDIEILLSKEKLGIIEKEAEKNKETLEVLRNGEDQKASKSN